MSDSGDRHDYNPENKTEFKQQKPDNISRFSRKFAGKNIDNLAQSLKRSMNAVRNRKSFARGK